MLNNKLWLLQLPVVALFTFAFWVTHNGIQGELSSAYMRENLFPKFRAFQGTFTDRKFKIRGHTTPKNKIVILEIGENELNQVGRWPWHRDEISYVIGRVASLGAKVVGTDIVFAEPDPRVPPGLSEVLQKKGIGELAGQFETDPKLADLTFELGDRLVLGWTTQTDCQPKFSTHDTCPIEELGQVDPEFKKFAYTTFDPAMKADQSPLVHALNVIGPFGMLLRVARQAGYFNSWPDQDGYVRKANLVLLAGGAPYPSLPLAMARVGLGKELHLKQSTEGFVSEIYLQSIDPSEPKHVLKTSPLGAMEINFRGPGYTFPYVGALQLFAQDDQIKVDRPDGTHLESRAELFKDAYVLIGVTAVGVNDRRAFPFDSQMAGTEGLASILDNILSQDMLTFGTQAHLILLVLLMTVGALLLAFTTERLESIPAFGIFLGFMGLFFWFDFFFLFAKRDINLLSSFYYTEMAFVFVSSLAVKYVIEERNKKFIKGAFSKYVAPAIVDSILKDPTKLTVGGEKRDLTILFSDIRGFTTFSENMDAPRLAKFLNDYLGIMTDLVFDNEGTLDKYIGDAVMAFWGAPLDQPKHAVNACKAAIAMQRVLSQHRARFKTEYGVDVDIGIGINSGPVNVGNMGSERIFEYTVIGDHVNLASRLEGLTKYYGCKILTTRYTFDVIQSTGEKLPDHRILDFVKVKGKKQAVELIQVLDQPMPEEALSEFQKGRKAYLERQFDDAIKYFEKAIPLLARADGTEDPVSIMYIQRCEELKKSPPNADWDGSWEMTSK